MSFAGQFRSISNLKSSPPGTGPHPGAHLYGAPAQQVSLNSSDDRASQGRAIAAREAICGQSSAFVCATTVGCDQQGWLVLSVDAADQIHVPGANCVERVRLGDCKTVAIVFRATAAAGQNWQTRCDQSVEERPSSDIDDGCIGHRRAYAAFAESRRRRACFASSSGSMEMGWDRPDSAL